MAKAASSKPLSTNLNRPNIWGMIQNIAIASMNRGQFPLVCAAAVIIFIIYKMPPDDISKLAFSILGRLEMMYLGGMAFVAFANL
jgi:hypothetical protein